MSLKGDNISQYYTDNCYYFSCYDYGIGILKDESKAFEYEEKGFTYHPALMYENGYAT
ncbi:hypothetical protein C1645_829200 [Glomus cerebriforme]|uniref:Uncharacterized protein n=1 Tax=Glomus cerebriforme TaxID=658196 RepID=A0A397SNJ7_9GLOM|nr:hypothetical protein C1645_829200 [Glomus cerebriforme]